MGRVLGSTIQGERCRKKPELFKGRKRIGQKNSKNKIFWGVGGEVEKPQRGVNRHWAGDWGDIFIENVTKPCLPEQ